jgi:hypothetical protein
VSLARYALLVVLIIGGSLLVLWPVLRASLDEGGRRAALVGGALAAANTLIAYMTAIWSERRSGNVFLRAVLGGMLVRMGLLLGIVVAAILVFGLPRLPLAASLLSYFVVFLIFEVAALHKRTTVRPEAQ